jgi:hypothetical protein
MEGNTNQDGQVPDTGQENGEFSDEAQNTSLSISFGTLIFFPCFYIDSN